MEKMGPHGFLSVQRAKAVLSAFDYWFKFWNYVHVLYPTTTCFAIIQLLKSRFLFFWSICYYSYYHIFFWPYSYSYSPVLTKPINRIIELGWVPSWAGWFNHGEEGSTRFSLIRCRGPCLFCLLLIIDASCGIMCMFCTPQPRVLPSSNYSKAGSYSFGQSATTHTITNSSGLPLTLTLQSSQT